MNEIKPEFSLILVVYLALFLFGIGYNWLITWMESRNYLEGYTAFAVVFGVGVTVALTAIVNWQYALITTGAFLASGLPMIFGSIWRYVRTREKDQNDARQTETVA